MIAKQASLKATSKRVKLHNVTHTLGDNVRYDYLWADTVGRARKCKPAKINGVLCSQVQPYYGQLG